MSTEQEIDRLIQEWGFKLGTEGEGYRLAAKRAIEMAEAKSKALGEKYPSVYHMPKSF